MSDKATNTNKNTWDTVAPKYAGRQALPEWGVFGVGQDNVDLLGEIEGKTFLEIACGSGHSIHYLIQRGASKVYGLDISHTQIELAAQTNAEAIQSGAVVLYERPMEDLIPLPELVDTVFSIYGLGWTLDLDKVLRNINTYLKIGGKFVWSWEHPIFPATEYQDGQFVITQSYHEEELKKEDNWGTEEGRYIANRKISTWYNSLRKYGFDVISILEPEPQKATEQEQNPERYYSIQKANLMPATIIFECKKITSL